MTKINANNKKTNQKIKDHILNNMPIEELKENIQALNYPRKNNLSPSTYQLAIELVEGGSFLVYDVDIENWLNGLGINPENKEYSNIESFNLYKHLLAREISKLLK